MSVDNLSLRNTNVIVREDVEIALWAVTTVV